MTEFREKLIDRMAAIYGLESPVTVDFARMCEDWGSVPMFDRSLEVLVASHEVDPLSAEDLEDYEGW